ncbi:MAG: acylphosphatase [Candidatus Acidiferrales bacterium]
MLSELHAKRFYISGMVQGVGFRFFARRQATRLGIAGYTRNLADGRVEVYAVGTAEQLQSLAGELARGPRTSSVERVEEEDAKVLERHHDWFSIEPGA